ncbi:MAG: glycoside hydrolase family 3 C-terminal domain-containing protein [Acidobacteriota bacterium]|nr:glycoside hydrolase family 3 C-terminal domain-containing protein [Acidobacteriota bacterium]
MLRFLLPGLLFASAAFAACPAPGPGENKPWLNPKYSPECRAQFVLATLKTVDEKFAFLESGQGGGRGRGRGANQRNVMADLGLNRGGGSDGPAGVRGHAGVTAFPTPLSVGANFDPAMASRFGDLLGQEFFAAGLNSVLGPAMDLTRTWHFGRSTESFGEDPFLTGATVGPEIAALQSHHVIVTMKHYAAYTQEQGRVGDQPTGTRPAVNEQISERALREIYLPGFESAVRKGGAGAVMCSFPRINGVYACENTYTLGILKNEWGFDGTVGPDFPDAQRSIVPAFLAGLDTGVITPGGGRGNAFVGQMSLRQGVDTGKVPMSRIDDLIIRRLVPGFRLGVFDHPAKAVEGEVSTAARRAAAIDVITGGAVLLKNEKNVLPIGPGVKSIAIIGTQATDQAVVVEQGSPYVKAAHLAPVLASVQQRAGQNVKVTFAPGTLGLAPLPPVPAAMLKTPSGQPGVLAEYFANPQGDFRGKPMASRVEKTMLIDKLPDIQGLPQNLQWSARYTTMFTPDQTGVHKFTLTGSSEAKLYIGGKLMGEFMRADFADRIYANVPLTAGQPVEIRLEFGPREALGESKRDMFDISVGLYAALGWAPPDRLIADAAEAARNSDVAIVFAGQQLGEGMDRMHLGLPNDQDALIEAVAKANPRTVVVLNTGGGVTMPWLANVAGLMEMWLPGDSYGPAAARLLFGDTDPGGRLPVTFPVDESQGPATKAAQYPGDLSDDGSLDTAHFDEGIFIGYRYWDQYSEKPLFPFGYGLSYSTFTMKGVSVKPASGGGATVDVAVRNTGKRAGSEVVQVYVAFPKGVGEPPKQLKGFEKVSLQPGESRTVHITLDSGAFKYWDEKSHAWTVAPGAYQVMAGRSSRDIAWTAPYRPAR